jgi:hypothetical protein
MRRLEYVLLMFLMWSGPAFCQKVVRIVDDYALIDANQVSGLRKGDIVTILRQIPSGEVREIANAEVAVLRGKRCATRIISTRDNMKVQVGDYIKMPVQSIGAGFTLQRKTSRSPLSSESRFNHWISYLSTGTGAVMLGLGFYFADQADQNHEDYLGTTVQKERDRLFNRTNRLDNQSNACLGAGVGLVAVGVTSLVFDWIISRNLKTDEFSFAPIKAGKFYGVNLRFNLGNIL